MSFTNNHNLETPARGDYEDQWHKPLNSNFEIIDDHMVLRDTLSNRPAAGEAGRIFIATDEEVVYHDNGTSWVALAGRDLYGDDLIDSTAGSSGKTIWDATNEWIPAASVEDIWVQESGDAMSGSLDLGNNNLINPNRIDTGGGGTDTITFHDAANTADLLRLNEGGNVEVPNRDIDGAASGALEMQEHASVSDTAKVQISRDAAAHGYAMVQDQTNNVAALVYLQGAGNAVEIIHDAGSGDNFTVTEGNQGTTNIYWDGTNGRYELENETGGTVTYSVEVLKA